MVVGRPSHGISTRLRISPRHPRLITPNDAGTFSKTRAISTSPYEDCRTSSSIREIVKSKAPWLFLVLLLAAAVIAIWLAQSAARSGRMVRVARVRALLLMYAEGSTNYARFYGTWPGSLLDLMQNKSNIVFVSRDMPLVDPWSHPFVYVPYDTSRGFGVVKSLGSDGKEGGADDATDIEVRFGTAALIIPGLEVRARDGNPRELLSPGA